MQSIPIWPVSMFYFLWNDHDAHVENLKNICVEQQRQKITSQVSTEIKHNLYESSFDFVNIANPSVEAWSHWVKDCIFQASARANKQYWPPGINLDVELHESWCHVTQDGGYHDSHIHAGSSWSCIYYLDIGDSNIETKNGVNRFYNPTNSMYADAGTQYMTQSNTLDIVPVDRMLIVFPSWIPHSAMPYSGTRDRYILSANSRITLSQ